MAAAASGGDGDIRAHIFVTGKVQGVYYRQNTMETAKRLGVAGWVRNLPDGRVEAMLEGEGDAVNSLIEWCRRGPANAVVQDVVVQYEEFKREFADFVII